MRKQPERLTIVARAVIVHRGKVLLTRMKHRRWYFLPGGHVDPGELVETALKRERREELGVGVKKLAFLGVHDNHFNQTPRERHHEIGMVFRATLSRYDLNVQEKHITVEWIPFPKLSRIVLLPQGIRRAIAQSIKTSKPFWIVPGDW